MNNQIEKYSYVPLQIVIAMFWSFLGFLIFLTLPFLVNQSGEMDGYQVFGLAALKAFIIFIAIFVLEMKTKIGLFFGGAVPILLLGFVY